MAESHGILASAVLVPELAEEAHSPRSSTKRRNSSISEEGKKRPRLSPPREASAITQSTTATVERPRERRSTTQVDEKKRGRRLFGALLGTLSQNSSSTVQKRRLDIEKKQQEKLKLQAEQYDQSKKRQQELSLEARRAQDVQFKKESMLVKHANMLAAANFLQTKAEPKLYYKPWELRPEEEAQIKEQLVQAQATIDEELTAQAKREKMPNKEVTVDSGVMAGSNSEQKETDAGVADSAIDGPELVQHSAEPGTNTPADAAETENGGNDDTNTMGAKETTDDGGDDFVEGEEDNVIY